MLLLRPGQLDERRAAAAGPLAPLADSLAADLEPLIGRDIYVPEAKALLSRAGGRCPHDGAMLEFDPWSPHEHCCATCGRTFRGELHHRWWVYSYQLWLAERAVHASLLHLLRGDARHGRLAHDIAHRYVEAYEHYPNRDNVLGPARVFFSTYLESIWLLQVCVVADLFETAGDRGVASEVRSRIVQPSAALIRQYDEGMSNRQVWNNAALLAAALVLDDRAAADRIVRAPSGVEAHLRHGLLADGSWYEGENYHLFAHRGLWYSVVMADGAGIAIDPALLARFQEGFATPFATALPDFTLPSRKDSQYAVSLQQSRFAELCELGLARGEDASGSNRRGADAREADSSGTDARLAGALARIYTSDAPPGDTGRSRSTADVERNAKPARLTRADLGWRSLLHARAELPPLHRTTPQSALLEAQGIAVFRREAGSAYVALDYGQSGGGHGHPDRLNVLFATSDARWLDDLGTGSYVDESLHWYRSTLAHNAPLIHGRSQRRVDGTLRAYDERGGMGWVLADVDDFAPGVHVERALIVTPDYFVDEVRWTATEPSRFELPIHFAGEFSSPEVVLAADVPCDGGDGGEDGFGFVREARAATVAPTRVVELTAAAARAWICASSAAQWFRALGPGQPATALRPFFLIRCEGTGGVIRSVWAWSPRVDAVGFSDERVEIFLNRERHVHFQAKEHWQIELTVGDAASGIELTGWRPRAVAPPPPPPERANESAARSPTVIPVGRGQKLQFDLGEPHYRRSEETWAEADRPSARVAITVAGAELLVNVLVRAAAPMFARADAVNPYDNEHPDINGDGVQLYLTTPGGGGAWILIPEPDRPTARARPLEGWGALELRRAEWRRTPDGYELSVRVALPAEARAGDFPIALDVLVNQTGPGRERRRGQLVLSGAVGEFVYLRGDRHDPARLLPLLLVG